MATVEDRFGAAGRDTASGQGAGVGWMARLAAILGARSGRRRAGAALERTGSTRLTPQHSLHVVRMGSRVWLVACHPSGTVVVDRWQSGDGGAEAAAAEGEDIR